MRHFIITAMFVLFAASPALAQNDCIIGIKICPDGSYVTQMGDKCEYTPCGGYPPPADPYAPPVGSTGHYTPPVKPANPATGTGTTPVNTCNKDVFTCPDGTSVTRVPPMCNFARCPETNSEEEQQDTPPEDGEESTDENHDGSGAQ